MNKILYAFVVVALIVTTTMYFGAKYELNTYKRYYNASEKLFDEIEEDNESYFDGDTGSDYLDIRKEIKDMNK